MDQLLSVIIPSFNEEGMIPKTSKTISGLLEEAGISYELIFVNDGSTDTTWEKIRQEASGNSCVKGVNFSRNFERNPPYTPACFTPPETAAWSSTAICSILKRS